MKSRKKIITIVWKIVKIIVPIGLIGIIIMKIDWSETVLLFKKIQWFYFFLAVIFYTLSQFWVAVRWRYLLNFLNIHTRFANVIGLVFVGLFVSNFLPTTIGGDAVRIIGISQNINEKDAAVSSVFADRIFGLLCSVLLIPLSLPYITNKSASQFGGGTAIVSSISVAFKKAGNFLKRLWFSLKRYLLNPRCVIFSLGLSWISFGFAILSFWILTSGLELQLTFLQIAQISVLSYFITLIPVSFNGLGLMEGSMIYLMTLHGADLQRCIAATVLLRFVMILTSLIGGLRLLFGWQGLLIKGNGKPAIN